MHHRLLLKTVRPLYRQLHPSRNLETIPGVGQDGAAVYLSFIGNPKRFHGLRELRGWSGMVPNSKQSSTSQASGLKITQAGPGLVKKFAFLDANAARQIIAERYTVSEEVRKRNSKAKRRERMEVQAEKKYKRGKAAPGDSGARA
jgi:hypothetical protein